MIAEVNSIKYIDTLRSLVGKNNERLHEDEIDYLEKVASINHVETIFVPNESSGFSKPKDYFIRMRNSFTFVKNGIWIPSSEIELEKEHFLGYRFKKHEMIVYGFFPDEPAME